MATLYTASVTIGGVSASAMVTAVSLSVLKNGATTAHDYPMAEIVGAACGDAGAVHVYVYSEKVPGCCSGERDLEREVVTLVCVGEQQQQLVNAITRVAQHVLPLTSEDLIQPVSKRRAWIFVNPVSGTRTAVRVMESCKVLLEDANIECTVHITTHANDCKDLIKNKVDILQYDAIMTVSGDGLLLEAISGVMERADWREVVQKVVMYPLPGGTGNGLSKSLCHVAPLPLTPMHATLVAAKGHVRRMDIATFETEDKGRGYSFLELMWGIPADVDIESEVCRFFGSMRLDIYGALRICCLRRYPGKLSYLPASEDAESFYWEKHQGVEDGLGGGNLSSPKLDLLPPFDDPVPDTWKVIEDDWVMIWAMNVTHAAAKDFVAPMAEIDDGYYHLVILRNASRCALLDMFLQIEEGKHIKNPAVEVIKTRAFRLEPQRLGHARGGILDIDGEVIPYGTIQMEVLRGFLRTYCPPASGY